MAYEWLPEHIYDLGKLFRSVLPNGYLALEHSPGHIPCGQGPDEWGPGGPMQNYDTLLSEFDAPLQHNQNVWSVAARTLGQVKLGGTYVRVADVIATDENGPYDMDPPWYLRHGTPRGPYYVVAFEYDTYHWVRNRISPEQVQRDRDYLRSVGYKVVC